MTEQNSLKAFHDYYTEFPYDMIEIKFSFTLGGSYDIEVCYFFNENKKETALDGRELFVYERYIYEVFKNRLGTDTQFNRVLFRIQNNGLYSSEYRWESDEAKKDLLDYANIFYQWVNGHIMSMIFEYEKDNNLIPLQYDEDGDLEYLSSWDRGEFIFHINDNEELKHCIELVKDGEKRVLDMPLKDYFIQSVLEHHKQTHNELADEWKPWNTMILKSLHNDIPYDKREEFVTYIHH